MPSRLRKFLTGPNRKERLVRYIARKLGVALDPQADAQPKAAPVSPKAGQPSPKNEGRFVAASEFVISRGLNGGYWVTHRSDDVIGKSLRRLGHFQENAIDDCLALLVKLGIPNARGVFLDVGANIGTHSLHAAELGFRQVISLEPNPVNFRLLQTNVVLNGMSDKVICRNIAASEHAGTMTMELSPINYGDHRMSNKQRKITSVHGEEDWESIEVPVSTLDEVLDNESVAPDALSLVWIDTQGHEGQVLAGGRKLRATKCPVAIEFWPYGLERSGGFDLLKQSLADYGTIIDLGASTPDEIVTRSLADLETLYAQMLSSESAEGSSFTDLLLIK